MFLTKEIYLLLLTVLLCAGVNGQYNPSSISKKATQLYTDALNRASEGEFAQSIRMLEQAVKLEPRFADAYLSIGGIYGELKNYKAAVENYRKARAIDSIYFRDYALPYSINLAGLGEFENALAAAEEFLMIPDLNPSSRKAGEYRKQCYAFAMDYAAKNADGNYKFEPRNLGDSINSSVSEYFPTITIDGSQLVYTRRVNNTNEDFYHSSQLNNTWKPAKSLEGDINTGLNEGAQNISQDGEWLILPAAIFLRVSEVVIFIFPTTLPTGGVLRRILVKQSIQKLGNLRPACLPTSEIYILPVTGPAGWERAIYISVIDKQMEHGAYQKMPAPKLTRLVMKVARLSMQTIKPYILRQMGIQVMEVMIFLWRRNLQETGGCRQKILGIL